MVENQDSPIKKLAIFINRCSDDQLCNFFKNTGYKNRDFLIQKEALQLCRALQSVARTALDPSSTAYRTFSFTFESAGQLRDTVSILVPEYTDESEINRMKVAMIEVGLKSSVCFQITVRDSSTGIDGCLHLKACHMINFQFKQPFQRKFVNLYDIIQVLVGKSYGDAVTIYHVEGSKRLSFEFDNVAGPINVKLLEDDPEIHRWMLYIDSVCSSLVPENFLSEVIPNMLTETGKPRSVLIEISEPVVFFKLDQRMIIGGQQIWRQVPSLKGLRHQALFTWSDCRTLLSAIRMALSIEVQITTDPAIIFRFKVVKLGDLWLAKKAIRRRINLTEGLSLL